MDVHIGRRVPASLVLCGALLGLGLAAPGQAQAAPCPAAFPKADVTAGLQGDGLTVETGTTPDTFDATVKGVITDGIAPGVDMILADTDSPALDRAGGIWAGMSGSPVYAPDGRLIGAVAYSLSFGPSELAGITPAEDMYRILSSTPTAALSSAERVAIPRGLRSSLVRSHTLTSAEAAGGMSRLPIPVGISGLAGDRLETARDRLGVKGVVIHAAGAASAQDPGDPGDIVAGGNFAAALSTGDVTAAGVGTTTVVCGTEALAFGHPFTFGGPTTYSAHGADAVAVVDDPVFSGFKVANITGVVGTVDRDRLAGIRGQVGSLPTTVPITSHLTGPGGAARDGETEVASRPFVPDAAFLHAISNYDRVFDRVGPGVSTLTWTVHGTRADGSPWSLTRSNRYADESDVSFASVFELADQLFAIETNRLEQAPITSVSLEGNLAGRYTDFTVASISAKVGGVWVPVSERDGIEAVAGTRQLLRVTLHPYRGIGEDRTVEVGVRVPAGTAGSFGELTVGGGGQLEGSGSEPQAFDALLAGLRSTPRNDAVVAELNLEAEGGTPRTTRGQALVNRVVNDSSSFPVSVVAPAAAAPTVVSGDVWSVSGGVHDPVATRMFRFGSAGSQTLAGDWTGRGAAGAATFRNGAWTVRRAGTTATFSFGRRGDLPVVGDWDGDGRDGIGVFRSGRWFLRNSVSAGPADVVVDFGAATARPVVGDWNGDGIDTVGTFSGGRWRLRDSNRPGTADASFTYGRAGDRPVVGDWDASGRPGVGVVRDGRWILSNSVTGAPARYRFTYGKPTAKPVVWR